MSSPLGAAFVVFCCGRAQNQNQAPMKVIKTCEYLGGKELASFWLSAVWRAPASPLKSSLWGGNLYFGEAFNHLFPRNSWMCERFKLVWLRPFAHSCVPPVWIQELLGQPFLGNSGVQQIFVVQDKVIQEFRLFLCQVPRNIKRVKQCWCLFYSGKDSRGLSGITGRNIQGKELYLSFQGYWLLVGCFFFFFSHK